MNKIYKVIWSKAKHTYVVASEIAKGHTKGETTGRGLKKLAAAMLVAAALMGPNFAWAAEAVTINVEPAPDTAGTVVEVYTKDGADRAIVTSINNATIINTNATNISTNAVNIKSNTEKISKLESAVGDNDSGLKKDVNDLKTTVGDSTGGLVKDVVDSKTAIDTEKTAREAGDKTLDDRITAVKEHVLKETGDNYVSKADAAVQDAGVVKTDKKIGENVTALGKGLYDETAARIGADAAQDKVIKQVNDNLVASVNTINKNVADGFTALNQAGANEAAAREAKDNELNERITNEANAIHDEIKAGDKVLDDRITNVKEYLEKQTSDNYVSKADAAVQDGAVVKAANTIGENVTNLDAALAKETAARLGADKAQDKVIQQVNQNMVDGFNTINKNMSDGFKTLNAADANEAKARADADAAEKAARIGADAKLVEAVNSSISLSADNVLQKNTTKVDADGNVTTGKADVTSMILNKGNDNQITLSDKGIKVGLNSGVMDKDGFYAGGDTAEAAKAALNADGSIKGAGGIFTVDGTTGNVSTKGSLTAASGKIGNVSMSADGTVTGVKDLTASGKVTADSFTDGTATMSNGSLNGVNQINATGNIVTTSNMKAHDITAEGTIKGESIKGTTGTFGSLSTTGNASVGGTLTTNGITNTGNATTDTLTVNHNATVGGNLGVTGDITGKSLNVGTGDIKGGQITGTGLDVGAGTIKTTGAVETGTLTTTGNATIGGDLGVKGNLSVEGEFNSKTLSSKLDENNYTTINGGNVTSKNMKLSDVNGRIYTSTSKFNEEGRTDTAADGTTTNVSVMTAGGSDSTISSLADKNQKSYITQNLEKILQGIKNGTNESIINQTETGIKSTATAGKNTASTNLSNNGFNTYATDGTNRTYTLQTAESLTSQIGDDGKVKSVMKADGITNNADGGTITNSAKDLVNTATGNMTNTVGGEMKTTVTGNVTEDFKSDLTTTIGGNKSEEVKGTSTETVTGKKTENYNSSLETTVTGEEKHTVNGSQTNSITGDQVNTIGGKQTTTVTGDVTEDYKANLSTTVGGSQTTTVTGDSSLTAENINNTAKNKITNKALDVETEAKSSIVSKVSNDAGSNTSTQLSYQTTEEMKADGKTASYLRGAAEEKSQLIDGSKKTTIDTVAGQTNTNITEGTNVSNSLQKADQIASSVTDGTNTTVVNQDAKSLASSITDGAKANNTNNTVDKSEQLIKADDTRYYAETKTAGSAVEALKSDGNTIISAKDAVTGTVSSAVTDGTNTTGSTMTAKGITNSAAESIVNEIGDGSAVKSEMTADGITNTAEGGTISNKSKNILNEASGDILNFADGEIGNSANKITNLTGDNTVTSDTNGTTFENKAHSTAIEGGSVTKTTISGNTLETGKATMDYAEVMKDLGVRGNATVDEKLTVKGDSDLQGNATVGKDLAVKGNTKLDGTLEVGGKSTFKDDVTMEKNLDVKGTTTTDTLHVTSTATFDDIVTMKKDLSVGGNVDAASYTVTGTDIKIDGNGINAGGTKVTGLAPADISHAGSTDAVSGGQLYETNTRVSGLETRMGTVETKVDKLDGKIDKVGANAAAMANLHPLEFDEDSKWNIAAAVGSSGSETASAVGVFYRPNENVMINASAAMGTGENMFGGGVSLRLGHGGNKAKEAQMKAAAAENKELRAKVDDLTARMDALLSVLNPNMSKDFPDVPENHWAYEAVSRLAGNGIVEGYEDGKYHGERQMTRYEMAEIIYNALSKGAKAEKKLVEEFRPELQAMAAQKKA